MLKKQKFVIVFVGVLVASVGAFFPGCISKSPRSANRDVASTSSETADSCESRDHKAWFNDGKYAVSERPDDSTLAAYDVNYTPVEGRVTERWTSGFSVSNKKPSNRKEFFSRGTFYYFRVRGMEDVYKGAESNFRLLNARVVGADSEVEVYRIDNWNSNSNDECPKPDKDGLHSHLVAKIPFFSLRTSGNRTNQMPKSSFKVKALKPEKWQKLATANYEEYVSTMGSAPKEIVNLAKEMETLLKQGNITYVSWMTIANYSLSDFIRFANQTESSLERNDSLYFQFGKKRNGMLWWKRNLEDVIPLVSDKDSSELVKNLDGEEKNLLKSFIQRLERDKSEKSWKKIVGDRIENLKGKEKDEVVDFLGMDSINLKAMWNDPSQMREALAWYMFEKAGVVAPKQTYAKLCFGDTYRGVFSVIEQIDETFVADRLPLNKEEAKHANLYKVYMGTEDVGLDAADLEAELKSANGGELSEEGRIILNKFLDHPSRGKDALEVSRSYKDKEPFRTWLKEQRYYFKNIGGGTLTKRTADSASQRSPYYKAANIENRTYQLQTDWKESNVAATSYSDLEGLINAINGGSYSDGDYYNSMNDILDTRGMLRWAAMTMLLGGWDNYYANPQNYYLLNTSPYKSDGSMKSTPKFMVLPWDYDQSFSMSFGPRASLWWNTNILDWESMRQENRPDRAHTESLRTEYQNRILRPLVTNMLKNKRFKMYYLKFMDWMIHNYFHVKNVNSLIGTSFNIADDISDWSGEFNDKIQRRKDDHELRLKIAVWDDPAVDVSNFKDELQERLVKEISEQSNHTRWIDFQTPLNNRVNKLKLKESSAISTNRCDQEAYVEPRSEKDRGQCQEIDYPQDFVYPNAWRPGGQARDKGIWKLIGKSVYEEHMGLPDPRWDIMSRTGRQYRNALIYDNGFLGRRIVWKELWQENPNKCNQQFKIFEGIEHHVRERGRTAMDQILQDEDYRNFSEENRKRLRNLSVEEISALPF